MCVTLPQSLWSSVHYLLLQGVLGPPLSPGEGLHLCPQAPRAPALWGDLLRQLRPRHHHNAILWLWDRNQAGKSVHLQQHWEVRTLHAETQKKFSQPIHPYCNESIQTLKNKQAWEWKFHVLMYLKNTLKVAFIVIEINVSWYRF